MAPTFFLKQFGITQVTSDVEPPCEVEEAIQDIKAKEPPKISPLRFLLDDIKVVSQNNIVARLSAKELSFVLKLTKFWVAIKPIKKKVILKRLVLRNIPADAEPIFLEPECMDCHDNDDGCDHCELPHECTKPHLSGSELMVAVAHPNALGEHAIGTFYRDGDIIYQWNGSEDVAILLPLENLDPELHYRFIY